AKNPPHKPRPGPGGRGAPRRAAAGPDRADLRARRHGPGGEGDLDLQQGARGARLQGRLHGRARPRRGEVQVDRPPAGPRSARRPARRRGGQPADRPGPRPRLDGLRPCKTTSAASRTEGERGVMATKSKISTEDWIEELKGISVLELSERIKALEEEFGVSATAVAAAAPAAAAGDGAGAEEESATVDVVLTG